MQQPHRALFVQTLTQKFHDHNEYTFIDIIPYDIISLMPSMSPHFTMRRPPYIGSERPNYLRYSWDRLRIFLHQLWILPKIQP
jgi:hypothetical protein